MRWAEIDLSAVATLYSANQNEIPVEGFVPDPNVLHAEPFADGFAVSFCACPSAHCPNQSLPSLVLSCTMVPAMLGRLLSICALLSATVAALAQSAATPPADTLPAQLHRLAIAAEDLRNHLPSFACTESFVSQELRNGKVHMQVAASGDLRVQPGPSGKLAEHFTVTQVNGRPSTSTTLRMPMFVTGGFQNALDLFDPGNQACFDFTASTNRIDFSSSPNPTPACKEHSDTSGFVLLDAAGKPRHLEHRIPIDIARQRHAVPVGTIDLTPTDLGGATFYLSTHVVADIPKADSENSSYHWEATYTSCRLYMATVKILPATADPTSPPQP